MFRPVSILPILTYLFITIIKGGTPDWGIFGPVSILPILSYLSLLKNHSTRYPRLGSIQTSLNTPHSELPLYNKYNMRYPGLGNIQTSLDTLPAWGISHYNFYKMITQNGEYRDWSEYSLVCDIPQYNFFCNNLDWAAKCHWCNLVFHAFTSLSFIFYFMLLFTIII